MPSSKLLSAAILLVAVLCSSTTTAFTTTQQRSIISSHGMESMHHHEPSTTFLFMADNNNNDSEDRLRQLGYTDDEIKRSSKESDREDIQVRVDMVDDVDAVSLTAIGFGLIAMNFFVFANMGDGGIAGLVARLMNSF